MGQPLCQFCAPCNRQAAIQIQIAVKFQFAALGINRRLARSCIIRDAAQAARGRQLAVKNQLAARNLDRRSNRRVKQSTTARIFYGCCGHIFLKFHRAALDKNRRCGGQILRTAGYIQSILKNQLAARDLDRGCDHLLASGCLVDNCRACDFQRARLNRDNGSALIFQGIAVHIQCDRFVRIIEHKPIVDSLAARLGIQRYKRPIGYFRSFIHSLLQRIIATLPLV